jgi:transcriptional regulator with XRE-family HTH domain
LSKQNVAPALSERYERFMPRPATPENWKLTEREKAICLRVREARNVAGVSQELLAVHLGIPRDRLATYEKGRAPIKFDMGLRICRDLIISEEWLATGRFARMEKVAKEVLPESRVGIEKLGWIFLRQCYDLLSEPITLGIPPGTRFSDAFDRYLAPTYEKLARRYFYGPRIKFVDDREEPDLAARYIDVVFRRSMKLLHHEATRAGANGWMAQRNLARAMFSFCHRAYTEFHDLNFDLGGFQNFVEAIEQVRRKTPQKIPAERAKVA